MTSWKDFTEYDFEGSLGNSKTTKRSVYKIGEGPPLVLMHELPGLSSETFDLAMSYKEQGFSVHLPLLAGKVGDRKLSKLKLGVESLRLVCLSREIHMLRAHSSSPITSWLRSLCNHIRVETGYPGVGVIGMCLTGNFAITLMADESVLGAVAAQPSLPAFKAKGLHMSGQDINSTIERLDALDHHMLAYRFKTDKICKPPKFEAIRKTFNNERERVKCSELDGVPSKENLHSVLVYSFDVGGTETAEVFGETVDYFRESFEKIV